MDGFGDRRDIHQRDGKHEGNILDHHDKLVAQRSNHPADGLRNDDGAHHLTVIHAERF